MTEEVTPHPNEELEAQFARAEAVVVDTSSADALLASMQQQVIPALRARQIRLVDAIQRYHAQMGRPYEHAQQRLEFERSQVELLGSLTGPLTQLAPQLDAADLQDLAAACEGCLRGDTNAPALHAVKVVVRGKARIGRITGAAEQLVLALLADQQRAERQLMTLSRDIATHTSEGQHPPIDLVNRVTVVGDYFRDLSARAAQLESLGSQIQPADTDQVNHALAAAASGGDPRNVIAVLDAVISQVSAR